MTFIEPLDLKAILVNTLSGSLEIFLFISFLFIASMAAVFRMSNLITLIMFAIFGVFLAAYMGGIYAAIVIFAGVIIFYSIGRIIKY